MSALGRPIHVCGEHVRVMNCPHECFGVELRGIGEMTSSERGCAICKKDPEREPRPFKILRKCQAIGCYGRYHRSSFDDLAVDEWVAVGKYRLQRAMQFFSRGTLRCA